MKTFALYLAFISIICLPVYSLSAELIERDLRNQSHSIQSLGKTVKHYSKSYFVVMVSVSEADTAYQSMVKQCIKSSTDPRGGDVLVLYTNLLDESKPLTIIGYNGVLMPPISLINDPKGVELGVAISIGYRKFYGLN